MDVYEAIKTRRSIRKYSSRPLEDEKLEKVLDAGRLSPSASNRQAWKFIAVRDKEKIIQMVEACNGQAFIAQAPAILVCCGTDPEGIMSCGQPRHTIDLSIATAYMILEAHELGLGTCWLGSFNEAKVKELLEIPENVRPVAVTPLGYPAERPFPKPRKPLDEVVCYDSYR
ncbi:MAG: nitroreductase family protein [Eubacteriales bacterium]|nr:nitroreductase family protein [Eubacteriales bacterium]